MDTSHIRFRVGKNSGMSVNLLNWTLCRSREFMLTQYTVLSICNLEFGLELEPIRVWFIYLELGIYIGHEIDGKCTETFVPKCLRMSL